MLNIQLNIGLLSSDNFVNTGEHPTLKKLIRYLKANGTSVIDYDVRPSNTEPTFVANCVTAMDKNGFKILCHALADHFKQDCVAVKIDGKGDLIGSHVNDDWLPFNDDYFITL